MPSPHTPPPATEQPPERALLQRLIEGPVSGDALARASGQTRAAVWKRISLLREAGVPIIARPGTGYALAQPMSLLDADTILDALAPAERARMSTLTVAWSIDSTNAELLRRPMPGAHAEVLLAERQTGGRGRRGRSWESPLAAHLYLSLQRGFEGGLARLGGLSLVAGVAAVEALRTLGVETVRLKWPNDLVVVDADGLRKLGGILVEGGGEHAGPVRAVLGIGVNVRMPEGQAAAIDQPWTDLASCCADAPPARNALAAAVVDAWVRALDLFDRDGLAPFRARYAAVDALEGAPLAIHTGNETLHGIADGIEDDGALRVRVDDALRAFHAGEVSVRREARA
ncbi:Bifunctional ligase/repressor BirA [Luteimonas sp. 9C]|uniref:bifunctional biotin--[acetyl-CoA-carboxylase] ligase/biotin operon repressor BirA n=1 Tax=Luteimonas sp. 9C TaxID=2653148 RepID=UPI0012F2CA4F|nr:bifunctional biotin--[acetyl-CoA-carboxylase] ligase/biotin operon repressor BirA [Luteimonas sp. 9C]VXA92485.1 Bifunctional ligase/repressor BirA [Luteimonas sp. 9C]